MGIPVFGAILIGLACSFIQSFGLTIQRKSHIQEDLLPLPSRRPALRRPLWLVGFTIYMTSNIFATIFQLDALPIVILAPLGAVSLIFNALLARFLLGDTFGPSWAVGTGLVAGGAVMIAVFGVVPDEEHGLDELLVLFGRGPFVAFFSVVLVITAAVLGAAHLTAWQIHRHMRSRLVLSGSSPGTPISMPPSNYASPRSPAAIPFRSSRLRRWSSPASPTLVEAGLPGDGGDAKPAGNGEVNGGRFGSKIGAPVLKPLRVDLPSTASANGNVNGDEEQNPFDAPPSSCPAPTPAQAHALTLCGLAFAAASGTLSGVCLVLAKVVVELIMRTVEHFRTGAGKNEFARPQTWVLLAGLGVIALAQIWYLNYSLGYAGPALICPLAFCFFNLSSIFAGLVFYDQFGQLATYQIILVSLGVAILLLGVWIVSAIQPQGGVEVGTWVEEDDASSTASDDEGEDELEPGEGATLLGGETTAEPQENEDDHRYPQPPRAGQPPHQSSHLAPMRGAPSTPPSPYHPVFAPSPSSPSSPMSPRFRPGSHHHHPQHPHHRHRGPRYGTLIPELAPHGAATGFSIGLGAASPGFALRSGSISEHHGHGHGHGHGSGHGHGNWGRSRSEGPLGLGAIIRGEDPRAPEGADGSGDLESGEGAGDNHAEAALRGWETRGEQRTRWWDPRRLWRNEGQIRLGGDEERG
ncbi:hypothetical protein IAT38_002038 [Cryptococcus sp. DSM 104549]